MTVRNKNLKREKAKFAYSKIIEVSDMKNKKFKSHIKNIPMYIFNNGLIATLTFIIKKGAKSSKDTDEKESYKMIGNIIEQFLKEEINTFNEKFEDVDNLEEVVGELIKINNKDYRRITLDILSELEWIVRFSDSMLKSEGD